jgi:4-oxalocrotonate tautomerase
MPAVTIDLPYGAQIDLLMGRSAEGLRRITDAVHNAMVETLNVPDRDRFQIVTEHEPRTFNFNRRYLDIERSEQFVLVRITLAAGRSLETKRAFFARLAQLLSDQVGLRSEDLGVMLTENGRED